MSLPKYFSDDCLVLKRSNFGEADKVLTLLGRRMGKFAAVAKGVRKITSRKAPHVELYNMSRLYLVNGHGLPIITQAETISYFGEEQLDLNVASLAFQLGEVVLELLNEEEPHPEIFDRLNVTLNRLKKASPEQAEVLAVDFQRFLLEKLGFGLPEEKTSASLTQVIERLIDRRLKSPRLVSHLA